MTDLLADLEQLRREHEWYCASRSVGWNEDTEEPYINKCDCGASEHNRRLDAVMERVKRMIELLERNGITPPDTKESEREDKLAKMFSETVDSLEDDTKEE